MTLRERLPVGDSPSSYLIRVIRQSRDPENATGLRWQSRDPDRAAAVADLPSSEALTLWPLINSFDSHTKHRADLQVVHTPYMV